MRALPEPKLKFLSTWTIGLCLDLQEEDSFEAEKPCVYGRKPDEKPVETGFMRPSKMMVEIEKNPRSSRFRTDLQSVIWLTLLARFRLSRVRMSCSLVSGRDFRTIEVATLLQRAG